VSEVDEMMVGSGVEGEKIYNFQGWNLFFELYFEAILKA
jgi:hypothetical protein